LLHVLDTRFLDVNNPELPYIPVTTNIINEETIDMLKSRLLKSVNEETQGKISVEAIVVQGVPFAEIIRTAKECNTDLIVLGTHGRTGLAHVVMGSVAEKVVRKAPCPVLTIRHPEHDFVSP
ncbi:MAG: universal stress protein, partial [Candidatus Kuenenia stuttgartiensis]